MRTNPIEIKKQAKEILDKFAEALSKVDKESDEEYIVERDNFERTEKDAEKSKEGFKERILKNAPKKDNDFIIAEKGAWK